MSEADTTSTNAMAEDTEDELTELDAGAVEQLAQDERRAKKTLRFEVENGFAEYTYQMVREGRLAELSEQHFETPEVRGRQQATDMDMSADDYERFRADVLKEAIVGAPEGHKNTQQYIRKKVPDEWQSELFEAITEFSSMDDEEYVKFR